MARRRSRQQQIPDDQRFRTVRIEAIVAGGSGMARLEDGRVAFVAFAAPGELVEMEVERIHPDYVQGVTARVLEASPERVEPQCPLFGQCGGCQLQHMTYEAQLGAKEGVVREQLRRIGGLDVDVVRPIAGAAEPWGYRNNVRFSTGPTWGDVGFVHRRGRGLLKVERCPIADEWVNELLPGLHGKARGLHQVQVRHSNETGSYLVYPAIPGVEMETGQEWYEEELGGRRFRVSASSFFQVNHAQAEQMVRLVGEALPERGGVLVDAFAGVGTFAAIFAGRFERVIAIEESRTAMRDAAENVADLANVELREGKVEGILPEMETTPDVVLLDPPRAGCAAPVLEAIGEFRPRAVVYVSCNPATLARDLRALVDAGFVIEHVTPLDMFPQTAHIEAVASLRLGGGSG